MKTALLFLLAVLFCAPLMAQTQTITLTWDDNPSMDLVTQYKVYRATVDGGPYTEVGQVVVPGFADSGAPLTRLCYVVTAMNGRGESGYSNEVCRDPLQPFPADPTGLGVTGQTEP